MYLGSRNHEMPLLVQVDLHQNKVGGKSFVVCVVNSFWLPSRYFCSFFLGSIPLKEGGEFGISQQKT